MRETSVTCWMQQSSEERGPQHKESWSYRGGRSGLHPPCLAASCWASYLPCDRSLGLDCSLAGSSEGLGVCRQSGPALSPFYNESHFCVHSGEQSDISFECAPKAPGTLQGAF